MQARLSQNLGNLYCPHHNRPHFTLSYILIRVLGLVRRAFLPSGRSTLLADPGRLLADPGRWLAAGLLMAGRRLAGRRLAARWPTAAAGLPTSYLVS